MPRKQAKKIVAPITPQVPTPAPTPKFPGVANAASLAARALARLEDAASKVHAAETTRRGFQAVSSPSGFQALIRHGKTIVEIQNDSFAVRQLDE